MVGLGPLPRLVMCQALRFGLGGQGCLARDPGPMSGESVLGGRGCGALVLGWGGQGRF